MHKTGLRLAVLCFGVVNAALYSALLPLWEGFDEPAHYGYVESLWETHRFPVLGRTTFPADVTASFRFAPASYLIHRWLTESTAYEDWFRLPTAEKAQRRAELNSLRPSRMVSAQLNYEAHHPPLGYIPLALIDWPISGSAITVRLLALRLFAAIASVVLLFFGTSALCRELRLPEPFRLAVLFTAFCSQMLYASTAHVTNDWLAVPVGAWCFASFAACRNRPELRRSLMAAAWLAVGLLTKAYFLAFALWAAVEATLMLWRRQIKPQAVVAATAVVLVVAGPWYARNLALSGNLAGTYEAYTGVGLKQVLAAAPHVDWPAAADFLARNSLWMGNNSGTSFSRVTLNAILVLLAAAVGAWLARPSAIRPAERTIFAGIAVFVLAIAYAECSSFACQACSFRSASPWYSQVLLAPVLALAYLGLSRWGIVGEGLASVNAVLWSWVLAITWVVKLFPLYSGAGAAPLRLHVLWQWYTLQAREHATDLSLTALAPATVLYSGLLVSLGLVAGLVAAVVRFLAESKPKQL
jgi:hypothetical protein